MGYPEVQHQTVWAMELDFMKKEAKSDTLDLRQMKPFYRIRKKRPPKVKIEDAANGLISLDARKADKGKYVLEVGPISLNIEVV